MEIALNFSMMYFSSPMWSTVGGLCVGFGCYSFVGVNASHPEKFKANYMEIGCIVTALSVQIFIDTLVTAWTHEWPRLTVITNIANVGVKINKDYIDEGNVTS